MSIYATRTSTRCAWRWTTPRRAQDRLHDAGSGRVAGLNPRPLAPQSGQVNSCARWITCADAVAKLVRDGCRRTSLLHGCYTADLDVGARRCPGQWAAWRLPNPLFQDRTYGLLPDSPQNSRLLRGTTNGDCRSMPVRGRQVGWFDGSRTEVAAPPLLSSGPPPGFRSGRAIGTKSLRSVPLTTNFAGRRCGRVHPGPRRWPL